MSDLYKEALMDAKKIKQIAEEEAKKQLLEKFTPFVKEMISKDLKEKTRIAFSLNESDAAFVVGEQEEDPTLDPALQGAVPPPAEGPAAGALPAPATATGSAEMPNVPVMDPATVDPNAAPAEVPAPPAAASTGMPPASGGVETPDLMTNPPATPADGAPVEPVGQELGSTTLDQLGADGKITVDVNDLFSAGAPEAIATADEIMAPGGDGVEMQPTDGTGIEEEEPSADDAIATPEELGEVPPTDNTIVERVESIVNGINSTGMKIDLLCLKESKVKELEKEFHKKRLFSLLEQVDSLKEKGLISGRQANILENKLEFLFIKLKEANLTNSYSEIEDNQKNKSNNLREETNIMTKRSLKSIAAKLFMEEVDAIEKTQAAADARSQANSKAAMSKIGNPKGYKADSERSFSTKSKEVEWDEQDPNGEGVLEENAEVGDETVTASGGFGDTSEDPETEFEVSEKELMEAIRQLRKENVSRKVKALKESLNECGDEEEEGGMMQEDDDMELSSSDDSEFDVDGDMDVEAAEADLQSAFDALGISDVDVDISMGSDDEDAFAADDEEAGEDEIEIVDDLGSDEEAEEDGDIEVLDDAEDEEEDLAEEMALYESRKRRAARQAKANKTLKEAAIARKVVSMKQEMQENNLFTAKTVFFNKLLMKENMSRDTTRKVVELLDKARNLNEAKEIYQKILSRLQESKQKAGSSTKATAKPLNESAQHSSQSTQGEQLISLDRWQLIAGIKK